jgi:hypothetical protein
MDARMEATKNCSQLEGSLRSASDYPKCFNPSLMLFFQILICSGVILILSYG